MIEAFNASADIPVLLRGLCTLGGMSLYVATLVWIGRLALGLENAVGLGQMGSLWFVRVLVACTLASLVMMVYTGRVLTSPLHAFPEVAILMLLLALYLLIEKRRFLKRRHIIAKRLPQEVLKIAGVTAVSFASLYIFLGFLQLAIRVNTYAGGPEWAPVFGIGLLALVPVIALYVAARERGMAEKFTFRHLLGPMVLACFLVMVPELIAYLSNSAKVYEVLHAKGRLQRVESITGKHNKAA